MRHHRLAARSAKRGISGYLDLTPVVDIVFNLLIFFALSLNFAPATKGIQIKVPQTGSPVEKIKAEKVLVSVYANGNIFLNDKQVSRRTLRERLDRAGDKSAVAVIRAEENVPHGIIVDIMASIRAAGYTKLAVAAKKL